MLANMEPFHLLVLLMTISGCGCFREERTACTNVKVDVVFLLDESNSTGQTNFRKQRGFVWEVVQQLDMRMDVVRVGLVTFATNTTNYVLLSHSRTYTVMNALVRMPYKGGGARNTGEAIHDVVEGVFNTTNGDRADAKDILVLITSGVSSAPMITQMAAHQLKFRAIETFVIGVGPTTDPKELQSIGTDLHHVVSLENYDQLQYLVPAMSRIGCQSPHIVLSRPAPTVTHTHAKACRRPMADIAFLVDASGSVGLFNFYRQLDFVSYLVDGMTIGPHDIRIAFVTFSTFYNDFVYFVNDTKPLVQSAIQHVQYISGGTNTGTALLHMSRDIFNVTMGDRPHVKNILIVMTDGQSFSPAHTAMAGKELKSKGIETFVLGIGYGVNNQELVSMATDERHVMLVDQFTNLQQHLDIFHSVGCATSSPLFPTTTTTAKTTTLTTKPTTTTTKAITTTKTTTTKPTTTTTSTTKRVTLPAASTAPALFPSTIKTACQNPVADIAFLVDASGSVGTANFQHQKDFVYDLINHLPIGSNNVRIAFVTFSTYFRDFVYFTNQTKSSILPTVKQAPYSMGGTHTDAALFHVSRDIFNATMGDRPGVKDILIVMTDGLSISSVETARAGLELRNRKIETFVLGIGRWVSLPELRSIATDDAHVMLVSQFTALQSKLDIFRSIGCTTSAPILPPVTIPPTTTKQTTPQLTTRNLATTSKTQPSQTTKQTTPTHPTTKQATSTHPTTKPTTPTHETTKQITPTHATSKQTTPRHPTTKLTKPTHATTKQTTPTHPTTKLTTPTHAATKQTTPTHPTTKQTTPRRATTSVQPSSTLRTQKSTTQTTKTTTQPYTTQTTPTQATTTQLLISSSQSLLTKPSTQVPVPTTTSSVKTTSEQTTTTATQPTTLTTKSTPFQTTIKQHPTSSKLTTRQDTSQPTISSYETPKTSTTVSGAPLNTSLPASIGCSGAVADVVFLVDTSASVGEANYHGVKTFIADLIQHWDIGPNAIRVGFATFSSDVMGFLFLSNYSKTFAKKTIMQAPYFIGGTLTARGINYTLTHMFRPEVGDRPQVPDILIILTDGISAFPNETKKAAFVLKQRNIETFVIGIGSDVNGEELRTMATDDSHVLHLNDFSRLWDVSRTFDSLGCSSSTQPLFRPTLTIELTTSTTVATFDPYKGCTKPVADIIFVIDSSSSVGHQNFEKMKQFITMYAEIYDISGDAIQVGVMTFSDDAYPEFELNTHHDVFSVKRAIHEIRYKAGGTHTDLALNHLLFSSFTAQNGDRVDAKNIVVILTDGLSYDSAATLEAADLLRMMGVEIYVIGIGAEINRQELIGIATDSNHLISLRDFNALRSLKLEINMC